MRASGPVERDVRHHGSQRVECKYENDNEHNQCRQSHKACKRARQNASTVAAPCQSVPWKRECAVTRFLRPDSSHRHDEESSASQGVAKAPEHPPRNLAEDVTKEIDLQLYACLTPALSSGRSPSAEA